MNAPLSLHELDKLQSIHGYTNLKKHETVGPTIMTRGKGVYVYDTTGKEYLEGMSGLWCASLGFSEQRLTEAAYKQMNRLPFYHGFAHKSHDVAIELANELLSIAPSHMKRVFFGSSGSGSGRWHTARSQRAGFESFSTRTRSCALRPPSIRTGAPHAGQGSAAGG